MSQPRFEILRSVVPLAILLCGVLLLVVVGRRQAPQAKEGNTDKHAAVQTAAVTPHTGGLMIEVDGLATPFREITKSAEVAGRVKTKSPLCESGTFVEANEVVLIQIDPEDYKLEIERLTAEIAQAESNRDEVNDEIESKQELIDLAQRDVDLREAQLKRLTALRDRNAVSAQNVDDAERNVIAARNSLLTMENQLDSARIRASGLQQAINVAKARMKQADLNYKRTTIKAPVSGVIISESVEEGGYVRIGDPLFVIEDTSAVEVRCNLRMEELRWVWDQDKAKLADAQSPPEAAASARGEAQGSAGASPSHSRSEYRLPATDVEIRYELGGRVYTWDGVLTSYDGLGLDARTRTVPCRIVVAKPRDVKLEGSDMLPSEGPRALVRGMFVTAIIKTQPRAKLLVVPDAAVQPGNVVWRMKDIVEREVDGKKVQEGTLERIKINIAQTIGDAVVIDAEIDPPLNSQIRTTEAIGDAVVINAEVAPLADEDEVVPLADKDRVVISPLSTAFSGMKVREKAKGSAGAAPSRVEEAR